MLFLRFLFPWREACGKGFYFLTEVKEMPSSKILAAKQEAVAALAEKIRSASAGVLVKYEGITVEDDTKLRAALRAAGVEYAVIKNSITGRACDEVGFSALREHLVGMTALAISPSDPVAAEKVFVFNTLF